MTGSGAYAVRMAGGGHAPRGSCRLQAALALAAALPLGAQPARVSRPPEWKALEARGGDHRRGGRPGAAGVRHHPSVREHLARAPGQPDPPAHAGGGGPAGPAVQAREPGPGPGGVRVGTHPPGPAVHQGCPHPDGGHGRGTRCGPSSRCGIRGPCRWTPASSRWGGRPAPPSASRTRTSWARARPWARAWPRTTSGPDSTFSYRDPQLFGSRLTLEADYGMLTDGYNRRLALRAAVLRPADPLVRLPGGGDPGGPTWLSTTRGRAVYQTPLWFDSTRVTAAWAVKREDDRALRAGLAFTLEDRRYGDLGRPRPAGHAPSAAPGGPAPARPGTAPGIRPGRLPELPGHPGHGHPRGL